MTKVLAERILQQYGLQALRVQDAQKGYRNESYASELADGDMVNAIIYKRESQMLKRIKNANYVSNFAAKEGMPARRTADQRILRLGSGQTAKYAALYGYLPGTTIPWEGYTMDHIKLLGKAMSDLHDALIILPQRDLPFVTVECRLLLVRMQQYFAGAGVRRAMAAKLGLHVPSSAHFEAALKRSVSLPRQALHMDFVRGNILFSGKGDSLTISGILDFEKTAWGPPLFDIARTLAFLLVDCKYKEESKVRKYFVHSGYNKRGVSSFTPTPLFETILDFFLLHDFYKFLRHNPYESLKDNEHYGRTRDFLLKRNILVGVRVLQ